MAGYAQDWARAEWELGGSRVGGMGIGQGMALSRARMRRIWVSREEGEQVTKSMNNIEYKMKFRGFLNPHAWRIHREFPLVLGTKYWYA